MNNDIIRRDCAWITIQGDTDAVLSVASTMAKHFHFDGEAMEIRYGANDTAQLCGIVDGKPPKSTVSTLGLPCSMRRTTTTIDYYVGGVRTPSEARIYARRRFC